MLPSLKFDEHYLIHSNGTRMKISGFATVRQHFQSAYSGRNAHLCLQIKRVVHIYYFLFVFCHFLFRNVPSKEKKISLVKTNENLPHHMDEPEVVCSWRVFQKDIKAYERIKTGK